jgi:methyltransferase (TIGR00027 family)
MIEQGFAAKRELDGDDGSGDLDSYIARAIQAMPTTAQVLSRASYAEGRLRDAVARGVRQYAIFGAGLDSFALRKPVSSRLTVFEIDAKDTQEFKKAQLVRMNGLLPEDTCFISADLSTSDAFDVLSAAGFSPKATSFISMLGLMMYLDEVAISALLESLSLACAPGSEIVFDCFDETALDPEKCSPAFRAMFEQSAYTGERYKSSFSESGIRRLAQAHGFSVAEYIGPDEIGERYFAGRTDAYRPCEHVTFVCLRKG